MLREGEDPTGTVPWTWRKTQAIAAVQAELMQISAASRGVIAGRRQEELPGKVLSLTRFA